MCRFWFFIYEVFLYVFELEQRFLVPIGIICHAIRRSLQMVIDNHIQLSTDNNWLLIGCDDCKTYYSHCVLQSSKEFDVARVFILGCTNAFILKIVLIWFIWLILNCLSHEYSNILIFILKYSSSELWLKNSYTIRFIKSHSYCDLRTRNP